MEKELIISSSLKGLQIAILENNKLVELHNQKAKSELIVGDIYLGRVTKILPGLNAAFVDIGYKKKDAFLHYTDLGPKFRSLVKFTNGAFTGSQTSPSLKDFKLEADIPKMGKVGEVLIRGQKILVQILKEPISTKGPRLCCEVTIAGRYLVLVPFTDTIAISKKIKKEEERGRLKRLMESIRPQNFGFIVRTAAANRRVADLHADVSNLIEKWEQIHKQLHRAQYPVKCLSELNKTKSIIRDLWSDSFSRVLVDDTSSYAEVTAEIQKIAPNKKNIIQLYTGARPIFDKSGVTRQIRASFGRVATMISGGYLVIEHTEAMHVVDVNSGHKMVSNDQEQNALKVNLEATEEIAHQLRLRDLGGIIVIDFIDMRKYENRQKLFQEMKRTMSTDTARHTILPLSKFGLMQITRERVRPAVDVTNAEVDPPYKGTVGTSLALIDKIKRDLDFIMVSHHPNKLLLRVHPFVQAYLRKGLYSIQVQWSKEHKKWTKIEANDNYPISTYKFFDEDEYEIRLR